MFRISGFQTSSFALSSETQSIGNDNFVTSVDVVKIRYF